MMRIILLWVSSILLLGCSSSGTKVVKPRGHKVWAKGNRYVIDIPVGNRHIRMLERKRTKVVRMK
jgi:alpha-tubulin suppressor-like RCC1 family protein